MSGFIGGGIFGGLPIYAPNAVTFDGTNDYLLGAASSPYFADSKLFSASFWFRGTDVNKLFYPINCKAGSAQFYVEAGATAITVFGTNSGGTGVVSVTANKTGLLDGNWHHVAISFDLSDSSNRTIKVDNANPTSTTWNTFANAAVRFQSARTQMVVGDDSAVDGGVGRFAGDAAEVYIAPGKNLRFDQAANIRKFISPTGKPIRRASNGGYLGADVPDVWLSGDTDAWHTNKGNAGGFTEFGALTTSADLPVEL